MAARGVADGVYHAHFLGTAEKRRDDGLEIRAGLRGLDDDADLLRERKPAGLFRVADDHGAGRVRQRGLDLGVALLADDHDLVALGGKTRGRQVHLLHEGAGGVEDLVAEGAGARFLVRGDAVGAQQQRVALRLLRRRDDGHALLGKASDDARVMYQGAQGVDGDLGALGRLLDHPEGPLDPVAGARLRRDLDTSHGYSFASSSG